jgi:APA family basic amino acid/polyamine antiporter
LFSCGELVAFCCVCTLILEYVLANAAVARSFSPYFGQLIGKGSGFFVFSMPKSGVTLDPLGAALVVVCVLLVCVSTEHSNTTNLIITVVHVAVVLMIMIVGFTKANLKNVHPFIPPEHGIRGLFEGASFVFFSFIGFDCVSTMAEEVKNPKRDMPVGIVSCIVVVTIIYVFMGLSLVLMVPYTKIDPAAAFAAAFETAGMPWMRVIVALGALLGIVTGVLVGSMAVSRIFSAVGRAHLVFPIVGRVHPKYKTPFVRCAVLVWRFWSNVCVCVGVPPCAKATVETCSPPVKTTNTKQTKNNSTLVLGVPTTILALVSDLPMLVNLVSAGTLFVFGMVALALIIKRYSLPPAKAAAATVTQRALRYGLISSLVGTAVALGVTYNLDDRFWTYLVIIGLHIALTIALHALVPQAPKPDYVAPLFPYVPSASLLINAWLCSTLPGTAWIQYAVFLAIIAVVYFVYSIAGSLALQEHSALAQGGVVQEVPPMDVVRVTSQTEDERGIRQLPAQLGAASKTGKGIEGGKAVELV